MSEDEKKDDIKLNDTFMEGWNHYEDLEHTKLAFNSEEYQEKVKTAMQRFENATRIVSQIGMFSSNEQIDEVSTESLQYLLLPFFLGKLAIKLHSQERQNVLEVAEVYLKDYLQRCREYEICDPVPDSKDESTNSSSSELAQLMRAANARNDKIALFRRKKELEEKVNVMRDAVRNKTIDDEAKREFFVCLLKRNAIVANEELQSIELEKQMLAMRKAQKSSESSSCLATHNSNPNTHHKHSTAMRPEPLKPFIITRNDAQKAVFGLGYPSLPIMTVDEFYTQRVRDGIFPDEEKVERMNRAQAIAAAQDPNEKEDAERAAMEEQEESDDPQYLERMRRMDDYKDVVRRGDGNRYNRS